MALETLTQSETQDASTPEADAVEQHEQEDVQELLTKDTIFELLKNQRRRDAIRYLKENDGEAKLGDMAEYIAAKENDIEIAQLSSSQRKRVYIGLYQCHLPKMANSGVIDFEKNRGDITLKQMAEQLEPYLGDSTPAQNDAGSSSSKRNAAVAGVVGIGVAAGLLGAPGFALVPDAAWAVVSTTALVVLTAMETYHQHDLDR
ncbi:hypothetical protein C499_12360 [Halogeometricum borinquense DSM 11551]|uniref:DUF7344 domain-containing protein n=2 Tax=Halogeometricum borinquense TaxID=60847 RepID=E4NWE2_HALBP|nr:hypothetical protein [Halogeometricum borinquense]ADQ69362.1 hypothetical protein Hbor_36560 [Halogeometricum borinquense DSM 11551]ELY26251.1 hypothetical protein C499_12360 [Halogeometricum borinquense DSM 11551]RYJ19585.1 hypothetical protein ELS19_00920 [Halogeometricum borinquense]